MSSLSFWTVKSNCRSQRLQTSDWVECWS